MLFTFKKCVIFQGNSIFYYKFGLQIPDSWSTLVEYYSWTYVFGDGPTFVVSHWLRFSPHPATNSFTSSCMALKNIYNQQSNAVQWEREFLLKFHLSYSIICYWKLRLPSDLVYRQEQWHLVSFWPSITVWLKQCLVHWGLERNCMENMFLLANFS